jgi:sec-independent protein translocase protein TatA
MAPLLAVLGMSGGELIIIFAVILVLFGAKKIPDFAKGLGQGIKEFKKASREVQDELERAASDSHPVPPPPAPTPQPDANAVAHTMAAAPVAPANAPEASAVESPASLTTPAAKN